jgi:hypothetical protein
MHKHLAPGNRVAEKDGFILGRFQGGLAETFVLIFVLKAGLQSNSEIASIKIYPFGA